MLSPKDIITESYNLYRRNYKPLAKIVALFALVIFLEAVTTVNAGNLFGPSVKSLVMTFVLQVPFGLVGLFLSIVLIFSIDAFAHQKSLKFAPLTRLGTKKFLPMLGASILAGAITALGFILFIIPGVYLWVALAFVTLFVVLDDQGIRNAMKKSRELSQKRFWFVFVRLLLPNLFWGFTAWLLLRIFDSVFSLTGFTAAAEASPTIGTLFYLINAVLSALVNALFIPLFTAVTYLLYKDLKESPAT